MSLFFRQGLGRVCLSVLVLVAVMLGPDASLVRAAACGTAPTVSFEEAALYAKAGGSVDYTVTITNNHAGSCDLDVSTSGDAGGFTSSLPDGTPFTVAAGATATTTLRVAVAGGTAEWASHVTTLTVDVVNLDATTTVFDNNPLLHNSINLNSTKHGGNWGTSKAGSKYGAITCNTCHVRNAGNIKRVRTSITTPDNTLGDFPGNGQPISFQDATEPTTDFGNDARADKSVSNAICEVCHTYDASGAAGVKKHAYDMSVPGDSAHFNQKDCTACHAHNQGFKAGACSGCHGGGTVGTVGKNFWPDGSTASPENDNPGRHLEHMDALASLVYGLTDAAALLNDPAADSKQTDLCGYCHDNPGGDADHSASLPAETAFHPVWNKAAAASGSYTTGDGNCTNICHNNHATGTGPGTWGWGFGGDAPSDCIMCHNDITVTTNTTGNTHIDHTGAAPDFGRNIVCTDCHKGAPSWATSTKPGQDHLNGVLDISGPSLPLTYTGSSPPGTAYGSCNNNACHNDGTAAVGDPVNNTYVWSDNNLSDCGICHAGLPTTNDHPSHVNTALVQYGSGGGYTAWNAFDTNAGATNVYDFGCGKCHGDTLNNHLNATRNVSVADTGWNGSTCSTAYCHSHKDLDGVATVNVTTPAWGSGFPAGDRCAKCHKNSPESAGHEEHQVGFHYNAVYSGLKDSLPVNDSDPVPAGLTGAIAQLRGHGGTLLADGTPNATTMTCYVCHNDTVTGKGNDLNPVCATCHDGGTTAPNQGTMVVANTNVHVNGQVNVVFVDEKIRSKAQVRDDLFDVPELSNNWTRVNDYKLPDGSSYDESPDTLRNMATAYGGWNSADKTCMISCHLWEDGRVDKYPVDWIDNSIHGPQPIMCIDCHTRLPK